MVSLLGKQDSASRVRFFSPSIVKCFDFYESD